MRKKISFAIAVVAILVLLALPAQAITYGTYDGNKHPEVGGVVEFWNGQWFLYCSGTLISPTVFLTAAHCYPYSGDVYVTFDPSFSQQSTRLHGTFHANPAYSQAQNDPHDIAVIVLDNPVTNIAPAKLPALGQFDAKLPKNQKFTAVGYGGQEPVITPGAGPVIAYLDQREYSVEELNAVNPSWLRLSQNAATGDAGACYGDSGGPNFLGAGSSETDIIAGTTITGDAICVATNVVYRLDTPSAQDFLAGFLQ